MQIFGGLVSVLAAALLSGCVSFGDIAGSLSDAVVNQKDPDTVRDGAPAYLILIDSLIINNPGDAELLVSGARLYNAYATAFVTDPVRAKQMSETALKYAGMALCEALGESLCAASAGSLDSYQQALKKIDDPDEVPYLYTHASAWAGWIQVNTDNWQAIADLPKVQAAIQHVLALDERYDNGSAHIFMGVLKTLRPAALGGQPELGRMHFEQAISLSQGKNLMAKVLFARHYARLVFDRALHDALLQQVLEAEVEQPGLTLSNVLAQEQARALLQSSDEYF